MSAFGSPTVFAPLRNARRLEHRYGRESTRTRQASIHTVHIRFGGPPVKLAPFPPQASEPEDVTFMRELAWKNGGLYAHN